MSTSTPFQVMKSDYITQSGSLQKKSLFRRKLAETHEEGAGAAVPIATTTGSSATCTTTTYSSAIRVATTDPSPTTDNHSILSPTACLGEGVTDLDEYDRDRKRTMSTPSPNDCICKIALQNENHHFHTSVEYIFQRLAAFILPVRTLRQFLRMGIDTIVSPTLLMTPSKEIN